MDEEPASALRNKKDSSMRIALNLVQMGKADGCVSAGNTGALTATARFVLKMLPGIDRPAIVSTFPTYKIGKNMRMLDLGANVDSRIESLAQFAVMGSVLASALDNISEPTVYLLNIGEEAIKGNEQVKQAAQLLSQLQSIRYQGFIEGDAIFKGAADVVVCDGFVGNVALKTSEGIVTFIFRLIKEAFQKNWLTKVLGVFMIPILKSLKRRIDPDRYNGAMLIGLNGIVIKSHGGAGVSAFVAAMEEGMMAIEKNIPERVRAEVATFLPDSSSSGS